MQHFEGPLPSGYESFRQYKQYSSSSLFLSVAPGDNCVTIGGHVCVIKNIIFFHDSTKVVFSKFLTKESFSTYPFDLKLIDIFLVANLDNQLNIAELNNIDFKCILLPHTVKSDCFVAMPLLHNV